MTTLEQTTRIQESVKRVYQAFFSPSRYEEKATERAILERGNTERILFEEGELAVTRWGDQGPAVLLMHGWGGARAQMTGFVNPLLDAGYRVLAYDQPAHGESSGTTTNILEIAPTMDLISERYGKFDAILAHSFGTLIASYALVERNFTPPTKLVYFGAFNRLLDSLPRFQAMTGLSNEIMEGLQNMFDDTFGRDTLDAIVHERLAPHIKVPALMFHDTTDNVTPIEDSRAIAKTWRSAQLIETTGLGHRGALQSKEIHAQVARFMAGI